MVTRKKFAFSSQSPVDPFLRRVLHATPSLQIDSPPGVVRCSGSRVKLPVNTTRLMFIEPPSGIAPIEPASESRLPAGGNRHPSTESGGNASLDPRSRITRDDVAT